MSLKGRLETFGFSIVLQLLADDQKTGVLFVNNGKDEARIYFKDGNIAYAMSSQKAFRLGQLLMVNGIVSAENLRKCLRSAKGKSQKLGIILVKNGFISMPSLKKVLNYQVKEILCDVFLWKTGEFQYREIPLKLNGKLITRMNIIDVIMEASRRIDEWAALSEHIASDKLTFRILKENEGQRGIRLGRKGRRILSLIDGTRTISRLVNDSGYDYFSTYKILYSLMSSGIIEKSTKSLGKKRITHNYLYIINIYNDIFAIIYKDFIQELGDRALTLFDESKKELKPDQQRLFKDFEIRRGSDTNVRALLRVLNSFSDSNMGRKLLTNSFSMLLSIILDKELKILGIQISQRTQVKLEEILSYMKEYQGNSGKKMVIVNEIGNIIDKASQKLDKM